MKTLLLLLMLVPALAQAACQTVDFNATQFGPVGTVTGGGYTLAFGNGFYKAPDSDDVTPPQGGYAPHWNAFFANEPSPGGAAAFNWLTVATTPDIEIQVTGAARYVEIWVSGSRWHCATNGYEWAQITGSLPISLRVRNGQYQWVTVSTPANWTGVAVECPGSPFQEPGSGCSGDPTGRFCGWYKLSVTAPWNIVAINISAGGTEHYFDALRVCSSPPPPCQNPPCETE